MMCVHCWLMRCLYCRPPHLLLKQPLQLLQGYSEVPILLPGNHHHLLATLVGKQCNTECCLTSPFINVLFVGFWCRNPTLHAVIWISAEAGILSSFTYMYVPLFVAVTFWLWIPLGQWEVPRVQDTPTVVMDAQISVSWSRLNREPTISMWATSFKVSAWTNSL